ncbi:dihydrofolate reductase family protein [Geodermatophilus sp. YIM 151500]|uniref:dihydrofolate reductase family protein n=1 Tax=Geodermatophilus sp. YIM 151500 TaxID=2984531 RepID=UPI0021E406F6|nr:dihydrofolate reductase family protein [Geodermatophilus sp. YIM 151500]MCV2488136.1 dihydrofolate reductase family protein [Geodermatophilus sp. YIM 151500]
MDASFTGHVFLGMSVDGFIARPDGDLSFLFGDGEGTGDAPAAPGGGGGSDGGPDGGSDGEPEDDFGFGAFLDGIDALLMGRSTYDFIAGEREWPYRGKPLHVLSTTLEDGADARVAGVHRSLAEAVAALDAAGHRDVYVDGGRTVHDAIAAGLIGTLTLSRVPVLVGEGHTPFGRLPADVRLAHVRTRTFPGGMVQSTYRVRR